MSTVEKLLIIAAIIILILILVVRSKTKSVSSLEGKVRDTENSKSKLQSELYDKNKELKKLESVLSEKDEIIKKHEKNKQFLDDYRDCLCKKEHEIRVRDDALKIREDSIENKDLIYLKQLFKPYAAASLFRRSISFTVFLSDSVFVNDSFVKAFQDNTMKLVEVPDVSAKVKGQSGKIYTVTLNSCTCDDFTFRHKPCKHMIKLALYLGSIELLRLGDVQKTLDNVLLEKDAVKSERQAITRETSRLQKEKEKVANLIMKMDSERAKTEKHVHAFQLDFQNKLEEYGYNPAWLAKIYGDYYDIYSGKVIDELNKLSVSAKKTAGEAAKDIKRKYKDEMRFLAEKVEYYESLLTLYVSHYPNLPELCNAIPGDNIPDNPADIIESTEAEDSGAKKLLSQYEYEMLSDAEKYQLALDRYMHRKRSNWEAGRDYERYIGYLYERDGYKVKFQGANMGLEDLGRDLLVSKNGELIIIQCKRWSADKLIHEKHIYQLFGTVTDYRIEHPDGSVSGLMVSTCPLSDMAQKVADTLKIPHTVIPFEDYSVIKCNINRTTGEKIYHLPFDQQYDKIVIDYSCGEFYAHTVAEAESKGFRRAWQWRKKA